MRTGKVRIVVVGLFDDEIYIKSKLKNEIIPEVLQKFPDSLESDIEFVATNSSKGVTPAVVSFASENSYAGTWFKINWDLGKEKALPDVYDRMLGYALENGHAYVVLFGRNKGHEATLYSKVNSVMEKDSSIIGIKKFEVWGGRSGNERPYRNTV